MTKKPPIDLLHFTLNPENWALSLSVSVWIIVIAFLVFLLVFIRLRSLGKIGVKDFEIDEAEFGIGNHKIKFKPSQSDKQLAFEVWVELSTRKIGLEIDYEHDVITEIYDSWYSFFSVTRELLKSVQVSKVNGKGKGTQKIIDLSIDILNEGLRPHLTKWQSRFRFWFDKKVKNIDPEDIERHSSLQNIQQDYPMYEELRDDMQIVNARLIAYREAMKKLAFGS